MSENTTAPILASNTAPKPEPSAARMAANRANAAKSTGPRTAKGKTRVAANALKHGLLAESIPTADAPRKLETLAYEATLAALNTDLTPIGPLELSLVTRLASLQSRLDRITHIESGIFDRQIDSALRCNGAFKNEDQDSLRASPSDALLAEAYGSCSRNINLLTYYEARLTRDFHRTLSELRKTQQLRLQASQPLPLPAQNVASDRQCAPVASSNPLTSLDIHPPPNFAKQTQPAKLAQTTTAPSTDTKAPHPTAQNLHETMWGKQ